ncbi:MAG: site-specific DNA-methyltransferase [Lachnospiraceae bacterium]|nr:site-specific DNA-methyltransferase [Lachnospiraceae bacterium]MBQ6996593.1 site-specific DNA-methyltransferase [Lachnospiraceae bacterium]
MEKRGKLELTWVGKYEEEKLEPRILIEDKSKSYGDPDAENMLIHGDNLFALKALENDFAGKIKCVYIDPPYNTGSAFEYYDDNLEHSIWLGMMRERLMILHTLLDDDGFLCCHIDDSEGAYLKVLLDEIFGRQNYLTTIYIRVRYPEKTLKQDMAFHKEIEHIHVYRKSSNAQPILDKVNSGFEKFVYRIETLKDPTRTIELGGKKVEIYNKGSYKIIEEEGSEYGLKEIWASGTILDGNSSGRFFRDYLTGRYEEDGLGVLYKVYGIGDDRYDYRFFTGPNRLGATKGKYYQGVPLDKLNQEELTKEIPINGFFDYAANFGNCRHEGGAEFRGGKKPEILLKMIFSHFSKPGDWVLDSFLGSGSSAAVAHKMNRKWIGIELGDHAYSLCKNRLDNVVSGEQTGISKDVNWQGGGGYKFYELAEPLLVKNSTLPIYQLNPTYTWDMVCEAICKIEGFTYALSGEFNGCSSENRFIHITEEFVNTKYVMSVMKTLGERQSLLIYCKKNQADMMLPENVEVKKIPKDLLEKCNFESEVQE